MAAFKHTMLFQLATNTTGTGSGRRIGGWSESYYAGVPLGPNFNNLCTARAALLPNGAAIIGQRIQQVDPSRSAQVAGGIFPGTAGIAQDIPQMALLCKARATNGVNARSLILRGIPDARVVEGELNLSGAFLDNLNLFFGQLTLVPWQWRARDLTTTEKPIFTVAGTGDFVLLEDFTFAIGDVIQVENCLTTGGQRKSGSFMVEAKTTARIGKLKDWGFGSCQGGTIRQRRAIVYPSFGTVDYNRITTRKVGRPFGGYVGRRSSRRAS